MSAAAWCRVLCCATLLLLLEVKLSSAQSKDVAFPTLPVGQARSPKMLPSSSRKPHRACATASFAGQREMPKATDTVKVNYHGWLDGGKVFDSSYKRRSRSHFR